jgi:hypothetical protein
MLKRRTDWGNFGCKRQWRRCTLRFLGPARLRWRLAMAVIAGWQGLLIAAGFTSVRDDLHGEAIRRGSSFILSTRNFDSGMHSCLDSRGRHGSLLLVLSTLVGKGGKFGAGSLVLLAGSR